VEAGAEEAEAVEEARDGVGVGIFFDLTAL
jgi:hypothetical protein